MTAWTAIDLKNDSENSELSSSDESDGGENFSPADETTSLCETAKEGLLVKEKPAFDKARHVELFRILENLDNDGKDVRVIRNLYWDQTASVRIEGEHSYFKPIK
ncbi:LINE-1 reverse transcriptase [Plakobranchus ocellatus]|uniref:LINE-1 reverse transcriptase n=1 Tax=Plakobranchus ocellatus TaxID=259542 RepID=A0AAV3ZYG4_9GAST|nr:LINE-1 reverse transcriptase [Plakobranchus ocellatus]